MGVLDIVSSTSYRTQCSMDIPRHRCGILMGKANMANVRNGTTFYIDAGSVSGTTASFIAERGVKVSHIIFTSSNAGDSMALSDIDPTTGNSGGSNKFSVSNNLATDTIHIDLSDAQAVFPNGIWVDSISAGATATLVLSSRGG